MSLYPWLLKLHKLLKIRNGTIDKKRFRFQNKNRGVCNLLNMNQLVQLLVTRLVVKSFVSQVLMEALSRDKRLFLEWASENKNHPDKIMFESYNRRVSLKSILLSFNLITVYLNSLESMELCTLLLQNSHQQPSADGWL